MRTFLLFIMLFCPQVLLADELADLQATNLLLTAELKLAKSAKLYMFIDLPGKVVMFKAGGVVVNRLAIDGSRVVGGLPISAVQTLSTKKAEKQPKRKAVKITTEAELLSAPLPAAGVDTLVALEIVDMPESYQLVLDNGLVLEIKAPPTGDFKAKVTRYWRDGVKAVNDWYRSMLLKLHGESETPRIILNLTGADARQFYWSFDEGMSCMIRSR